MILDKVEKQKYRHELKYVCTEAQLAMIQARIHHLIPLDKHAGESGMYQIRSLYFDDYYDRCYYENENGTDYREKFRIRTYDNKTDEIHLECKSKVHGFTKKQNVIKRNLYEFIKKAIVFNCDNITMLCHPRRVFE